MKYFNVILLLTPSRTKWCNFTTLSVLNAADVRPKDIYRLPVSGRDVRNSSNSLTLRWQIFNSEVEKLKWFSFDLALKLALKIKLNAVTIQCVLPTRPSQDGKCRWSVLEN